jgi:hypothetical protein
MHEPEYQLFVDLEPQGQLISSGPYEHTNSSKATISHISQAISSPTPNKIYEN